MDCRCFGKSCNRILVIFSFIRSFPIVCRGALSPIIKLVRDRRLVQRIFEGSHTPSSALPFDKDITPSPVTRIHSQSFTAMSCNICHTPILVDEKFLDPNDLESVTQEDHLLPIVEKVCPARTHQPYFKNAIQIDRRAEGVVLVGLAHAGRGLFIGSHWKIVGGIALAFKQEDITNGVSVCSVNPRSNV